MAQLGFGLNTNTTAMESGYDLFQKKEDFEFISISIILAVAIILAIIIYKKALPPPEDNKSLNIDNLDLSEYFITSARINPFSKSV